MKNTFYLLLILFNCAFIYSQDGNPDSSFGTGGKIITDVLGFGDVANDLVIQNDGKILVAGYCRTSIDDSDFCVVRYNTDGNLDTTFGINGTASFDITGSTNYKNDEAKNVLLQSDGKIVLTGFSPSGFGGVRFFTLIRLNIDGTLDTTYGDSGKRFFNFVGSNDTVPNAAIMLSNDKVVIVGHTELELTDVNDGFAIAQIDSNGNLDQDFSIDGRQTLDFGGTSDNAYCVTADVSGNLIIGGVGNGEFALIKYTSSGNLDTNFNSTGIVTTDIGGGEEGIRAVQLLSDGKIMAVGRRFDVNTDRDIVLLKYNSNGSLDNTFGTNGIVTIDIDSSSEDLPYSMAIQSDGKIVISGSIGTGGDLYFITIRFNADGTLDNSFSGDGIRLESFGTNPNSAQSVKIQTDGKLLVVGYVGSQSFNSSDFAIVRYNNSTLSLSEETITPTFIYPNPSNDIINIKSVSKIINLSIYDNNGRLLKSLKTTKSMLEFQVDISDLSNGIYILELESEKRKQKYKFIKK